MKLIRRSVNPSEIVLYTDEVLILTSIGSSIVFSIKRTYSGYWSNSERTYLEKYITNQPVVTLV